MTPGNNGDPVRGPLGGQETVHPRTLAQARLLQQELDALVDGDATIVPSVRLDNRQVRFTLVPVEILRFHWPEPVAFRPTHVVLLG